MANSLCFDVLALDVKGKTVFQSESNLLYSFLSFGKLWKTNHPKPQKNHIKDDDLEIHIKTLKHDFGIDNLLNIAFKISLKGSYLRTESIRKDITKHLKDQGFDSIYILVDDISQLIAEELYPLIYKVENQLRAYLIQFMTIQLGPKWWELTATSEVSKKVYQRRNNEQVFGPLVDNNAYLIDFGDLGRMIYSYSSGFINKEDIIKKISNLDETPEAIRDLKEQLKSNYSKYFKESFQDNNFQEKWENLEAIRHKVAHNNLFTNEDLKKGKKLSEELISIIEKASDSIDAVNIPTEDKQAIKDSFLANGLYSLIDEDEFLTELKDCEAHFSNIDGFVSLSHFVKQHLGAKGYHFSASFEMVSILEAKGVIEIYHVENPKKEYPTSAIRSVNTLTLPD